jgi:hypothetical protein
MSALIVYVDVDDTLIRSAGTKRLPIPSAVARVRKLKMGGATLYLWSTAGADYARATAEELRLTDCFAGYLPKPTVIIDDQPIQEWRDFRHYYPLQDIDT